MEIAVENIINRASELLKYKLYSFMCPALIKALNEFNPSCSFIQIENIVSNGQIHGFTRLHFHVFINTNYPELKPYLIQSPESAWILTDVNPTTDSIIRSAKIKFLQSLDKDYIISY